MGEAGPVGGGRRRGAGWLLVALAMMIAGVGGFLGGRASVDSAGLAAVEAGGPVDLGGQERAAGARGPRAQPSADAWHAEYGTLEELMLRSAPGGVDIRLYRSPAGDAPDAPDLDGHEGGAVCDYSRTLVLELSNRGAVSLTFVQPMWSEAPVDLVASGVFGVAEGDPAWWVALHAGPGAVEVRGAGDRYAVTDGWAVLAGAGAFPGGDAEVVDESGATLATVALDAHPTPCTDPGALPVRLPEPGEQPEDPAAAEGAVLQAYHHAWTHDVDPELRAAAMEDAEALERSFQMASENFPEASATITVEVREVVFTDPTAAAVRFELFYSGGAQFGEQLGHARLVDGRWVVARPTICKVLGWAGAAC